MEIENKCFDNLSIEELNKINITIYNEINEYNQKITKLQKINMNIDQIKYKKCDHIWTKDSTCTAYERAETYCCKCNLLKKMKI